MVRVGHHDLTPPAGVPAQRGGSRPGITQVTAVQQHRVERGQFGGLDARQASRSLHRHQGAAADVGLGQRAQDEVVVLLVADDQDGGCS